MAQYNTAFGQLYLKSIENFSGDLEHVNIVISSNNSNINFNSGSYNISFYDNTNDVATKAKNTSIIKNANQLYLTNIIGSQIIGYNLELKNFINVIFNEFIAHCNLENFIRVTIEKDIIFLYSRGWYIVDIKAPLYGPGEILYNGSVVDGLHFINTYIDLNTSNFRTIVNNSYINSNILSLNPIYGRIELNLTGNNTINLISSSAFVNDYVPEFYEKELYWGLHNGTGYLEINNTPYTINGTTGEIFLSSNNYTLGNNNPNKNLETLKLRPLKIYNSSAQYNWVQKDSQIYL